MDELQNGRIVRRFGSWLTFFNGGDPFLIPRFWHKTLYLEMMAFLSMGSENCGPVKLKHAAFKVSMCCLFGTIFEVSFNLLGILS